MRTILFMILLLSNCIIELSAQCFYKLDKQRLEIYNSSGDVNLDTYLKLEKDSLQKLFSIRVDLKFFNDSLSPNAYASCNSINPLYYDGTIYLGITLLSNEVKSYTISTLKVLIAHECAHVLQLKLGSTLENPYRELQADFLAGYYLGKDNNFQVQTLLMATKSLYSKGDFGLWESDHHGTPLQRYNAILAGYLYALEAHAPKQAYYYSDAIFDNDIISNYDIDNTRVYCVSFILGDTTFDGLLLIGSTEGIVYLEQENRYGVKKLIRQFIESKLQEKVNYYEYSHIEKELYMQDAILYNFYFFKENENDTLELWVINSKGQLAKVEYNIISFMR